jgi:hypothetical protein
MAERTGTEQAAAVLAALAARDIRVTAEGDRLALDPGPGAALTDADRQALRDAKPALLRLLTEAGDPAPRFAVGAAVIGRYGGIDSR